MAPEMAAELIEEAPSGLAVTMIKDLGHQLLNDSVEITLTRSTVKPRLKEIRALPKNECHEMFPIVNAMTKSYNYPLENTDKALRPFNEGYQFRVNIRALDAEPLNR